jgi:hypothetical protein
MDYLIKLKSSEAICNSTPSSFGNASIVRLTNSGATTVITQNNASATVGTMTLFGNTTAILQKSSTDNLTSTSNVQCVAISYRD